MSNRLMTFPKEMIQRARVGDTVQVGSEERRITAVDLKAGLRLDNGTRIGIARS